MAGEILRKKREELGKDLEEIAKVLKIRYDYLKAIEDGDLEKLPAEVYIKGYIREYAEVLKIDPEIAIKAYIQKISPPQAENIEAPEKEVVHRKKLKIKYFLIPSLLALLAITIIFIIFPSAPPPPVENKKDISPSPIENTKEVSPPLPSAPLVENPPHVLEVFATDTTWLFITIDDTNGKEILLKPGESTRWGAKNSFSLKIGNAGGVKLVFDGKEIGKLGEKGQVINLKLP